jgi:hypothetical protein
MAGSAGHLGNVGQFAAGAAGRNDVGRAGALLGLAMAHGDGDGPGAAAIDPKPRSFADVAWQDSVTDDHIKKVIVYGGAAVGKSPMMVGQPQLKGNDKVLDGLVQIVRGFKGK